MRRSFIVSLKSTVSLKAHFSDDDSDTKKKEHCCKRTSSLLTLGKSQRLLAMPRVNSLGKEEQKMAEHVGSVD